MPQTNSVPTPTPPQNPGDGFRDFGRRIAEQALGEARREVQAQLDAAVAEQKAIQARLDVTQSGSARRDLQNQLQTSELKIEKLQEALDKIEAKSPAPARATQNFPGITPPPSFPERNVRVDPTEIVAVSLGILFVAFPLTLAFVRFIWKRSSNVPTP